MSPCERSTHVRAARPIRPSTAVLADPVRDHAIGQCLEPDQASNGDLSAAPVVWELTEARRRCPTPLVREKADPC